MAGITLQQAEAKLAEWMSADTKVSAGQEYSIAGRTLRRSDAQEIRENIKFWDAKVRELEALESGSGRRGPRVGYIVPSE